MGKIDTSILERAESLRKEQDAHQLSLLKIDDKSAVVELTRWRFIKQLRQFCCFLHAPDPNTHTIEYHSENAHIEVTGSGKRGLPTVFDADVLDCLISMFREQAIQSGVQPRTIYFTRTDLLHELNKNRTSGKNKKEIIEALDRLSDMQIKASVFKTLRKFGLFGYHVAEEPSEDGREVLYQVNATTEFYDILASNSVVSDSPRITKALHETRSPTIKAVIRVLSGRLLPTRKEPLGIWQETLMRACNESCTPKEFRRRLKNNKNKLPWGHSLERRGRGKYMLWFWNHGTNPAINGTAKGQKKSKTIR